MKKTVRRPKLPPIPRSLWLPFWLRLKALFRLYLMSPSWLSFNSHIGSCSASILAPVQLPQWLCFGVFIVALFQQSHPPPLPSPPPPSHLSLPSFSFSTPGSWPPARPADQWEIQARAFCLGWHFAFVFPSRL